MAKRKASKKKPTPKKSKLEGLKTKKTNELPKIGKRKARKKQIRKPSQYNAVKKTISEYCLRKYGRRCSKKEISEIYSTLKNRFIDNKSKKNPLSIQEIQRTIDEKLAYYGKQNVLPIGLRDFVFFDALAILYWADGGFFKEDDILNFDMSSIGEGIVRCTFNELPDEFNEGIKDVVKEWVADVLDATGIEPSPLPTFVFDEDLSDFDKREFTWVLDIDYQAELPTKEEREEGVDDGRAETTGAKETKAKGKAKGKAKPKARKEVEPEVLPESVLIEREKTLQAKEKSKQEAMELLRTGAIDLEAFKMLIR